MANPTVRTAEDWLEHEVLDRLEGIGGVTVRTPRTFLLGAVQPGAEVQVVDLSVVIEVSVRGDTQAARKRLTDAFHVLGERTVPNGQAFAMAVPPFGEPDAPETFTVVVRRDESGQPLLYSSALEGNS